MYKNIAIKFVCLQLQKGNIPEILSIKIIYSLHCYYTKNISLFPYKLLRTLKQFIFFSNTTHQFIKRIVSTF